MVWTYVCTCKRSKYILVWSSWITSQKGWNCIQKLELHTKRCSDVVSQSVWSLYLHHRIKQGMNGANRTRSCYRPLVKHSNCQSQLLGFTASVYKSEYGEKELKSVKARKNRIGPDSSKRHIQRHQNQVNTCSSY